MLIRELEMKDIDQVCIMEEEAFSMPWHRESFVDMVNNPDALYLVAEDDRGKVLGACGLLSIVGEGSICNIVVKREYRGQGIGSALVAEMLRRGEEDYNIKDFTLEVRVSNKPARELYQKYGFEGEGVRPGFYEKPAEDALIMWRRNGNQNGKNN